MAKKEKTAAELDGTAKFEKQEDALEARNKAVADGQKSARENLKAERAEQPAEEDQAGE